MSAHLFEIAIISAEGRQRSTVIAHGSLQAMRIALPTFDQPAADYAVTCRRLAALTDEEQPCAA